MIQQPFRSAARREDAPTSPANGRSARRVLVLVASVLALTPVSVALYPQARDAIRLAAMQSRIQQGFTINPVTLNMRGKNRNLVGYGSYLVNGPGACGGCHTFPNWAPGGDPTMGQPKQTNTTNFMAGGFPFAPDFLSPPICPEEGGLPAGHTYPEFLELMRGPHAHHHPGIQQLMPWPSYANQGDLEIRAMYEYLRACPHTEPAGPPG